MIVVDIETTGLDPALHSIVSIGAVDFNAPERQFYRECRIWEGAQCDPQGLAVNGFSVAQVTDPAKPSLEKIIGEFIVWTNDCTDRLLAGHNTFFDRDFLRATCARYHIPWDLGHRIVDLHSVCWASMVRAGVTLPKKRGKLGLTADVVLTHVGLPEEPRPHNGMVGAAMEAEAFSRLVRGTNLLPEYKQYPVPDYLTLAPSDQSALF